MKYETASIRMDSKFSTAERLLSAAFAILLGMFIVLGVGFAHPETLHNAAHDGRHAFAFPCH